MTSHPCPLGLAADAIEAFAGTFTAVTGYKPGASLHPLVAKVGGRIVLQSTPSDCSGPRLIVSDAGRFDIFVPTLTTEAFNRMAIATALGFYILHAPFAGRPMTAPRWPDPDRAAEVSADIEATRFAYSFLMPKAEFVAAANAGASRQDLAIRFGVSQRAAALRAHMLGAPLTNESTSS